MSQTQHLAPRACPSSLHLTYSHSHILTLSHTHTLTYSHSHILTLSHTHTLTCSVLRPSYFFFFFLTMVVASSAAGTGSAGVSIFTSLPLSEDL